MSPKRYTADTITDGALDQLYRNANNGWRRGDRWKARATEAEAAVERARALHTMFEDSDHCQHDGEPWPCPTLRALADQRETSTP